MVDQHPRADFAKTENVGSRMNRRSILRGLGAGGLGLFGIRPAGAARPNATIEIDQVKTKGPNGEEKVISTRKVPRRWYNQMKRARRVNNQLQNRFISVDGVLSVGVTALEENVAGRPRHGIEIKIEGESINPSIPRNAGGVPIVVRKNARRGAFQTHASCDNPPSNYNRTYDPISAGVVTEPHFDSLEGDNCSYGTVCCRVNKDSSSDYVLTARHLWNCALDDSEIEGRSVYQHGDWIGTVSDAWLEHDAAVVSLSSSRSASLDVVDDPNGYPLFGYVTKNEMGWLLGTTVQCRGVTSGAVTATPTDYETTRSTVCGTLENQVEYDRLNEGDGDSGGPYFYDAGHDEYHLLGMHSFSAGSAANTTTTGVAGYALSNQHSIWPAF